MSRFGDGFFNVGVLWLLFAHTHSVMALGVLWAAYMFVGGVLQASLSALVDRLDRRSLAVWLNVAQGTLVAGVPALATQGAFRTWELYPLFVLVGLVARPLHAAVGAMLPGLVRPGDRHRANAVLAGITETMAITGPIVGGVVIARWGSQAGLAVDAASFLMAAGVLAGLPRMSASGAHPVVRYRTAMTEGMRRLWTVGELRLLTALLVVEEFTDSTYAVLAVPLVVTVLHHRAPSLGLLEGSLSAGLVLGSVMSRRLSGARCLGGRWFLAGGFSAAYAVLVLVPHLYWRMLLQVAAGTMLAIVTIESRLRLQHLVPPDALGSVLMWQEGLSRGGAKTVGSVLVALTAVAVSIPGAFVVVGGVGALLSVPPALALTRLDSPRELMDDDVPTEI